jgi:hypothetical protein
LQQAIAREEKIQEIIEKKVKKKIERTVAREELAREKVARQHLQTCKVATRARSRFCRFAKSALRGALSGSEWLGASVGFSE